MTDGMFAENVDISQSSRFSAAPASAFNHNSRRRPLHEIQSEANVATTKNEHAPKNRLMGPQETMYFQKYDSYVTEILRASSNAVGETKLIRIRNMNHNERLAAMENVDQLLSRLNSYSNQSSSHSDGSAAQLIKKQSNIASTFGRQRCNNGESDGSITTMCEQSISNDMVKDQSEKSAITIDGNTCKENSRASVASMIGEQSLSNLEQSMVLLSEDDSHCRNEGADEMLVSNIGEWSGILEDTGDHEGNEISHNVSPIERARHNQQNYSDQSRTNALDSNAFSPSMLRHKHSSKRPASNSGQRGYKSKFRNDISEFCDDYDEPSLFRSYASDDNGYCIANDAEDTFSCGSPIQRRFSYDEHEKNYPDEEEMDDAISELTQHKFRGTLSRVIGRVRSVEDNSVEESRFSIIENESDVHLGTNTYNDENDFSRGDPGKLSKLNHNITHQNQLSQWSAFQNADAKLTLSQVEGEKGEESPVRSRVIQFDGCTQRSSNISFASYKYDTVSRNKENEFVSNEEVASVEQRVANIALAHERIDNRSTDVADPIQTVRNLSRRAKALESQGVDSSLVDEVAPTDIRLRHGAHFRLNPLSCHQNNNKIGAFQLEKNKIAPKTGHSKEFSGSKRSLYNSVRFGENRLSDSDDSLPDPETSFTDPISVFPVRIATRLNAGYNFMLQKEKIGHQYIKSNSVDIKDKNTSYESCAVLLPMPIFHIVATACKLLFKTMKSSRSHQRAYNEISKTSSTRYTAKNPLDGDILAGGTLIVVRGKEDIAQWEVALREYTSLSVINHAQMQSNHRKFSDIAARCAGFDVVLSTYDIIKSKEITVALDIHGVAIICRNANTKEDSQNDGGWLQSRTSGTQSGGEAPQKCHKLSVLHRILWYRVVLVDVLGRKGYLTKPGTARTQTAAAFNCLSRFILFEKGEDAGNKLEENFKEDRRQLRSIASALHLPSDFKLDKFVSEHVLNVDKVGRDYVNNVRDVSSSSDE